MPFTFKHYLNLSFWPQFEYYWRTLQVSQYAIYAVENSIIAFDNYVSKSFKFDKTWEEFTISLKLNFWSNIFRQLWYSHLNILDKCETLLKYFSAAKFMCYVISQIYDMYNHRRLTMVDINESYLQKSEVLIKRHKNT